MRAIFMSWSLEVRNRTTPWPHKVFTLLILAHSSYLSHSLYSVSSLSHSLPSQDTSLSLSLSSSPEHYFCLSLTVFLVPSRPFSLLGKNCEWRTFKMVLWRNESRVEITRNSVASMRRLGSFESCFTLVRSKNKESESMRLSSVVFFSSVHNVTWREREWSERCYDNLTLS